MFYSLFNLSQERNLEEALVFYFFYLIFTYFIAGLFFSIAKCFDDFFYKCSFISILLTPFVFYTFISIGIIFKKKLKDYHSILLVLYTAVLTLLFPVTLVLLESFVGFYVNINEIEWGIFLGLLEWFLPSIAIGGIPVALLTMKEDLSLSKEIQQMEQEKLEQERKVEKQLLTERAITSKLEEIKKHVNNAEDKGGSNEDE